MIMKIIMIIKMIMILIMGMRMIVGFSKTHKKPPVFLAPQVTLRLIPDAPHQRSAKK